MLFNIDKIATINKSNLYYDEIPDNLSLSCLCCRLFSITLVMTPERFNFAKFHKFTFFSEN